MVEHQVIAGAVANQDVAVAIQNIAPGGADGGDGGIGGCVVGVAVCLNNLKGEELSERFIRGDASRTTEGSGLGLSIAKSLTELQGGEFKLYLDGDLFKVMITFATKNYSK